MKDAPINLPPLPDAVRFLKPSERLVRQQVVPILEAYARAAILADRAGRVQLLHETRALLAEWGEWYYCRKDDAPSHKMERVLAAIDAAIAAAPNAQEE
jgi:hypothetical protein